MATATITIRKFDSESDRDAVLGWDEGDIVYVVGVGLTYYDGQAWQIIANQGDLA